MEVPSAQKKIMLKYGYYTLYPPQELAVKAGLLEGENLVVSAPTASGKTLIAELAIIKRVLEVGGKALYLVPLRALASEKYNDFLKYKEIGLKIALSTGDYDSSDPWLDNYDIIITTNEKADSLLRHRSHWLNNVTAVVFDEIHLVHSNRRGPTLEMVVAYLRKICKDYQILALSATISNAREVAEWLNAKLVQSEWRPVTLKEGVYYDGEIIFSDGSSRSVNKRYGAIPDLVLQSINEGGQTIIFSNTRNNAVSLAKRLVSVVNRTLTIDERRKLRDISDTISTLGNDRITKLLATLIKSGVAFHHAGLQYNVRKIIEDSFRATAIKAITATPTLAAGVNLPARRVIFASYRRYNAELGFNEPIPVLEYKQMAGRAGRPKYDKYGESILIANKQSEVGLLIEEYIKARPERIISKLASEPALRTHILASIASGYADKVNEVMKLIDTTFFGYQFKRYGINSLIKRVLSFLHKNKMLVASGERLYATPLGVRVSQLYIDPYSAKVILKGLHSKDKGSEFAYLHLITCTPDMPKLYLRQGEREKYTVYAEEIFDELLIEPFTVLDDEEFGFFLSTIKTAKMLYDWINEVPEDKLVEDFEVGPGDIYSITQTAEWLVYAAGELAAVEGLYRHVVKLKILRQRVKHGVKEELLELARISGIGRARARVLYMHGLKTLDDLRKVSVNKLVSLPLIGLETAKRIKSYFGERVEQLDEEKNKKRAETMEDFLQS